MGKLHRRLYYWVHQRRIARELNDEIELHRSLKQEELERTGLASAQAATQARRALGNALISHEDARGVWISPWLDQLWQDIRYGARQLSRCT